MVVMRERQIRFISVPKLESDLKPSTDLGAKVIGDEIHYPHSRHMFALTYETKTDRNSNSTPLMVSGGLERSTLRVG